MPPARIGVVGAGLIGAATARHLAVRGADVLLVGPPETDARAEVFASHYDQGRVVRRVGKDATWTQLNLATVDAVAALEAQTGLRILHRTGCWTVLDDPAHPFRTRGPALAAAHGIEVHEGLPDLPSVPGAAWGLYEPAPSGSLDPRALVRAQRRAVADAGGTVVHDVVRRVSPGFTMHTASDTHTVDAVVVCAGAFTASHDLLPPGCTLPLHVKSETVVLADLEPVPDVPALLWEIDRPTYEGVYATCALRYPDGRTWLKLGANLPGDRTLNGLDDLQAWFRGGDTRAQEATLADLVGRLFPGHTLRGTHAHRCAITRTPSGLPIVGEVAPGWFVGVGGNGYGAMASEGLGRALAARVLDGRLPRGLTLSAP
jgi:sarcosine oxidase